MVLEVHYNAVMRSSVFMITTKQHINRCTCSISTIFMSTTKIRLSIVLPGSTLLSQEETCKLQNVVVKTEGGNPKIKDGKVVTKPALVPDRSKFDHFEVKVMDKGKQETIKVSTRKCKPATQVISLSEEAYDYFVDPFSTPYKFKGVWKSLTKNQKVQWHCQQIAEAMGGKLESFVILE